MHHSHLNSEHACRLSPRSVPPLPHSRLFAVSPRSSSSPELDSPLEEAVDELISAACNLEDVQVHTYPHSIIDTSQLPLQTAITVLVLMQIIQHLFRCWLSFHGAISTQSILQNSEDCAYAGSSVNYQEGRQQAGSRLV